MTMRTMFPSMYEDMKGESSCFVTDEGRIIYGSNEDDSIAEIAIEVANTLRSAQDTGETSRIATNYKKEKKSVISGMYIPELKGTLVSVDDISESLNDVYKLRTNYIIGMLIILAGMAFVIDVVVNHVLKKFYEVLATIRKVRSGNLDVRTIESGRDDEMGELAHQVTDAEISHLNNYQATMAQELKMDYTPVQSAGLQTLNGLQATAYCRIRYTAGDDFKRAERQRTVLMACLDKAKNMSYSQLETVANKAFGETYTSLDLSEILDLLKNIANYEVVDNNGFPEESMRATGTIGKKGSCVVAVDLESNVKWLHQFLFEDSEYTVSDDVKKYSEKIHSDTSSYLN